MPQRLRLGVGAKCCTMLKYLHPAKLIDEKYPNRTAKSKLDDLLVIRQEIKKVNKKEQRCIVFRHGLFDGVELYCVQRWAKVLTEGAIEHLFDSSEPSQQDSTGSGANRRPVEEEGQEIDDQVLRARNCPEDISTVRAQGLEVDDDNKPAPENIPCADEPTILPEQ